MVVIWEKVNVLLRSNGDTAVCFYGEASLRSASALKYFLEELTRC